MIGGDEQDQVLHLLILKGPQALILGQGSEIKIGEPVLIHQVKPGVDGDVGRAVNEVISFDPKIPEVRSDGLQRLVEF